jgi:hypothetical protein
MKCHVQQTLKNKHEEIVKNARWVIPTGVFVLYNSKY